MNQEIKRKLTRQKLIDRGYELINMYGYHAVSIDLIIKEVGLTKGAFYYHFKNKHQFIAAIINERVEKEIHSEFIEPICKRGNPIFILTDLLQDKLINDDSLNPNLGSPIMNLIVTLSYERNDYQLQAQLREVLDNWKIAIINLLHRGIEDGYIARHVNTEPVAEFIINSLEGVRTLKRTTNNKALFYNFMEQFKNYLGTLKPTKGEQRHYLDAS
ncbi:MAG: TetR/AcrR family transcriptional regulator [Flavobacteriaceae bacterium]|nr:TetR/AcrR family transcriptional regulator [Flavobacteriaceae bacterium]